MGASSPPLGKGSPRGVALLIHPLRDVALEDRRVFLRADLDVPLEKGRILDAAKLEALLPTVRHCLARKARVVLAGSLGNPRSGPEPKLSLEPVGAWLAERLDAEILLTDEPVGDGARRVVQDAREGQVVLLENLAFHPGERQGEEAFARSLAEGMDLYVNEAFGVCQRRDASVVVLPTLVQERAAGLSLLTELEIVKRLRGQVERPFVLLLGGQRVSEKLPVMESLLGRVDTILIGGALAYTFLQAQGHETGTAPVESAQLVAAGELLRNAALRGVELLLSVDHRLLPKGGVERSPTTSAAVEGIPREYRAVDIGPRTAELFAARVATARTLVWHGLLGQGNLEDGLGGTRTVAGSLARRRPLTVIAGGETTAFVRREGLTNAVSHLSTGGQALLEAASGRTLPGIAALES